jgi:hypothetical protein
MTNQKGTKIKKGILKLNSGDSVTNGSSSKEICWGDIVIFEFANILGDNPAVSEGAPLTIAWNHDSESVVAIEYYEYLRQSRPRRKRKELVVSSGARDTL